MIKINKKYIAITAHAYALGHIYYDEAVDSLKDVAKLSTDMLKTVRDSDRRKEARRRM